MRDESGKILILVLVLLVVGGLLLGPLLGLMSTGLASGQVYEKKTDELYAADAGVEAAVWGIQTKNLIFNDDRVSLDPVTVNGKTVRVEIEREDLGVTQCRTLRQYRYYILSEAFDDDGATTVNAVLSASYTLPPDFSGLLRYAIASNGTIPIDGRGPVASPQIKGDVWIRDPAQFTRHDCIEQPPYRLYGGHERSVTWPTFEQLRAYYWEYVKHLEPSSVSEIIVPRVLKPSLWTPSTGTLTINGDGWVTVTGTVYVEGNLVVKPHVRIALGDGAVLFVEGSIVVEPNALGGISSSGSGCIISRGNIDWKPMVAADSSGFVLTLSLEGRVLLEPMGTFQGTVASLNRVEVQPQNKLGWISPEGKGLNFPMGNGEGGEQDVDKLPIDDLRIDSWQIQQGGQ